MKEYVVGLKNESILFTQVEPGRRIAPNQTCAQPTLVVLLSINRCSNMSLSEFELDIYGGLRPTVIRLARYGIRCARQ